MYAIETYSLSKEFRREPTLTELLLHPFKKRQAITAVHEVDLRVKRGEVFGLLGPNGAGKTTLIKLLCNLIIPSRGRALVNGYDLLSEATKIRRSVGLTTSDERSFFWRLSGRRNLEFFASLYDLPASLAGKRVQELLEMFDLERKADLPFRTYSAGMKKKMAVARGLLNDPQTIFMDEVTNSLDPPSAQAVKELVREKLVKQQGKTVFWATHRLEEVADLCDRLALMNRSIIEFVGTVADYKSILRDSNKHILQVENLNGRVKELLNASLLQSKVLEESGQGLVVELREIRDTETISQLLLAILSAGGKVKSLELKEPSLADVFSHLVDRSQQVV
jgi:ABC-2 type transport system ATP-binding protein